MGVLASLERPEFSSARTARWRVTPVAGMAGTIIALHAVGWGVLVFSIVPQSLHVSSTQIFGMGIGTGAYLLGARHAFDVDHIAAIDCTTRKLIGEGLRPLSVGFWFSLGHASVVFGLCALLAGGAQYLGILVGKDASPLHEALGLAGTTISGVFLYILAALNVTLLIRVVVDFRRLRAGHPVHPETGSPTTLMVRVLRPVIRSITHPWQMYLVGLLFGLGFDTATEVALLVIAGGAATMALPWYAVLILPVLFAAGMSLFDTVDGWFMNLAYNWAFSKPDRRLQYNVVLTGLSAAVALSIGTVELISVVVAKTGTIGGALATIGSIDLTGLGYAIVGIFVLCWVLAACASRLRTGRKAPIRTRPAFSTPSRTMKP
ncbi:HoxN/HupN/NixA family nickel/cobalt transporter [Paenarthrobacter sp. RAF54_2]|uniref:HoxN/HupN/NixA family nickel/cobalt transporter n=1 Tax=Paenarthrobacter sp. RAF54_2 TaxID=3233061 RepID=UPI003F9A2138